jgi:hypothetical protein
MISITSRFCGGGGYQAKPYAMMTRRPSAPNQ